MGVYLSSPVTEKISDDKSCAKFKYGVSSMQGWRMSQEDAHNCINNFDGNNTALFAVYDGHGGAEVAQYTAAHLPDFIKNLPLYKDGKLTEALQEAFLGFDKRLTEEAVIQELKALAGVDDEDDNVEPEDEEGMGRSERDILVAEANMPIEELISKYSSGVTPAPVPQLKKLQKEKNQSPMIKAKKEPVRAKAGGSGDTNNSATDPLATGLDEKLENGQPDNDNNLNAEKELLQAEKQSVSIISKTANAEPDSTGDVKSENNTNTNNSVNNVSNGENKHLDSQGEVTSDDKNSVKNNVSEPDSTSDQDKSEAECKSDKVTETKSVGATITSESAVTSGSSSTSPEDLSSSGSAGSSGVSSAGSSSSSAGSSSSGACSSSGVSSAASSSSSAGSSGVSSATSSNTESSGSGSSGEPSGSGMQAGGSGLGNSKKASSKLLDDVDSDDDDSTDDEDEEYMEDSEDEEDDEDDDDDEDSEQGGIFGVRGVGVAEEEDHVEEPGTDSGCTAVVALIREDKIYVANAGDSRCVLCQAGKAVDLSFDHKPEDDSERTRIEAAGGKVTNDGRVNGGLNLSRALGDHWYKRNETKDAQDQMISALPDIECATITSEDEFLVIACDGIWNFMTSQETIDFVRERLNDPVKAEKPSLICEEMFDHCLAPNTMGDGTGCDNMTCIIVVFNKHNSSSKRDNKDLDVSASDETQPEKRARVEEEIETMATSSDT